MLLVNDKILSLQKRITDPEQSKRFPSSAKERKAFLLEDLQTSASDPTPIQWNELPLFEGSLTQFGNAGFTFIALDQYFSP